MSFFNQQHYLESIKTKDEMQLKEDAPLLSPERRALKKLARIPEASPGPNAFAQQAARMERHRLDSNAFYQQEVQRRGQPALAHPALRGRSMSDPPTPPRDSICTTMSPFIGAGRERENEMPLKLVPDHTHLAEPTTRGMIEERREQLVHESSGSEEERTPVFVSSATFEKTPVTPRRRSEKIKEVTIIEQPTAELPAKTPKRSILEKLRLNTSFRSSLSSPAIKGVEGTMEPGETERMPVKAKAVLGSPPKKSRASFGGSSSPSKTNLPRSPSKRKGLFSRKTCVAVESTTNRSKSALSSRSAEFDYPPNTASTLTKTPPTAFSGPTHYSYGYNHKGVRIPSQTLSDQSTHKQAKTKKSDIVRSQSLKYFDQTVPPTPPAKDTPPDEQARRETEILNKYSRIPLRNKYTTPSKTPPLGLVSDNDYLSPTKLGTYGHREMPTLITQPSVYSMHASVVPDLTEASTFDEMKARIDGLGLEGFSLPPENTRSPKAGVMYTPSIYSTEWNGTPKSRSFYAMTPPAPLAMAHTKKPSEHSKDSSSNGTIPVIYPELAKDPSYSDMTAKNAGTTRGRVHEHLQVTMPWHGRTHSRDHSSDSRQSRESGIFAHHVDDDLDTSMAHGTPASFSHPSATPSPLHYLPASTYTAPPRKESKQAILSALSDLSRGRTTTPAPLARTPSISPSRFRYPLDTAPSFPPTPTAPPNTRNSSPRSPLRRTFAMRDLNGDPPKTPSPTEDSAAAAPTSNPTSTPAALANVDTIVDMLEQLKSRNHEISSIRDEMRASNFRVGERLAAVEGFGTPTPPASASNTTATAASGSGLTVEEKRISSAAAHDFYRTGEMVESEEEGAAEGESECEGGGRERADTIAELRQTNSKLLEMVSGFAERIRSLEGRYGGA